MATAWQLIHRFSEDIDLKVAVSASTDNQASRKRREFRTEVLSRLQAAGYVLDGQPLIGNKSQFFRVSLLYGPQFPEAAGIRPGLRVEMTFGGTHRQPQIRPVRSLLSGALRAPPEVPGMLCVDPLETAADKLSALAWRTAARDRSAASDDPSIVRHLHDLAAMAATVSESDDFPPLARRLIAADARRSGDVHATGPHLLREMLPTIQGDPLWRRDYEQFVGAVSFGTDAERISFDQAVATCNRLVETLLEGSWTGY